MFEPATILPTNSSCAKRGAQTQAAAKSSSRTQTPDDYDPRRILVSQRGRSGAKSKLGRCCDNDDTFEEVDRVKLHCGGLDAWDWLGNAGNHVRGWRPPQGTRGHTGPPQRGHGSPHGLTFPQVPAPRAFDPVASDFWVDGLTSEDYYVSILK